MSSPCNVKIDWIELSNITTVGKNAFGLLEISKPALQQKYKATFSAASQHHIGDFESVDLAKVAAQEFIDRFVFANAGIDGIVIGKSFFDFLKMGFSEATALAQDHQDGRFLAFALTYTDLEIKSQLSGQKLRKGDLISVKDGDYWIATTVSTQGDRFFAGKIAIDHTGCGESWCFGLHDSLNIFKCST